MIPHLIPISRTRQPIYYETIKLQLARNLFLSVAELDDEDSVVPVPDVRAEILKMVRNELAAILMYLNQCRCNRTGILYCVN